MKTFADYTDDHLEAIRRADQPQAPAAPTRTLSLDPLNRVLVDGKPVTGKRLTVQEGILLRAVMRRAGVATKEYLLQELYGGRDEPLIKIIDVFACKVRAKLGRHRDALSTSWGRGYVRGEEYQFEDSMASLPVSTKVREMLDAIALESDRRPDELGQEMLLEAIMRKRKQLWDAR